MGNGVCKQNARRSRRKLCGGETDGVGRFARRGKRGPEWDGKGPRGGHGHGPEMDPTSREHRTGAGAKDGGRTTAQRTGGYKRFTKNRGFETV
eukprot:3863635-Rhodomonas_salina.3